MFIDLFNLSPHCTNAVGPADPTQSCMHMWSLTHACTDVSHISHLTQIVVPMGWSEESNLRHVHLASVCSYPACAAGQLASAISSRTSAHI